MHPLIIKRQLVTLTEFQKIKRKHLTLTNAHRVHLTLSPKCSYKYRLISYPGFTSYKRRPQVEYILLETMGRAELAGVGRGSRSSWPEAVGLPVATAALLINGVRPVVAVTLIMETEPTRRPGRPDPKRVILVSDAADIVIKTPLSASLTGL